MTQPDAFYRSLAPLLGEQLPELIASMREPPVRGLQLGKTASPDRIPGLDGPVPWAEGGFYIPLSSRLGQSVLHEAGAFYLQEPSAMAPAEALGALPDEMVLDLCAAPGGKTFQLAKKLTRGTLVANEIHPARAKVLSANAERMGLENTVVTNMDPERLSALWPDTFDRVLVDAPCSGEGMFRRHPEAALEWQPAAQAGCAKRQRDILRCAARMVRPGGEMVYSTCTFNQTENDDQIAAFLRDFPDFEPVPFCLPGLPEAKDGTLHIWPHRVRGEGHFIARLHRKGNAARRTAAGPLLPPDRALAAAAGKALEALLFSPVTPDCALGERLFRLPAAIPALDRVRVLRAGLCLGRFQGKVFIPDHALARAAKTKTVFPVDEAQALSYLHGDTLPLPDDARGFGAVVFRGFPLGWGKASDGQIKNHYPKGLRKALLHSEQTTEEDDREPDD